MPFKASKIQTTISKHKMNSFSIISKTLFIATIVTGAHLHQLSDLHSLVDYNSLPFKLSTSMNVDYHSPDGCTRYRQLGDQIFVTQYCDKNGDIDSTAQSGATSDGSNEQPFGTKDDIEGLKALRAMIQTTKGKRNHKRNFKHKRFARFHRF